MTKKDAARLETAARRYVEAGERLRRQLRHARAGGASWASLEVMTGLPASTIRRWTGELS